MVRLFLIADNEKKAGLTTTKIKTHDSRRHQRFKQNQHGLPVFQTNRLLIFMLYTRGKLWVLSASGTLNMSSNALIGGQQNAKILAMVIVSGYRPGTHDS